MADQPRGDVSKYLHRLENRHVSVEIMRIVKTMCYTERTPFFSLVAPLPRLDTEERMPTVDTVPSTEERMPIVDTVCLQLKKECLL
jgi:hypothetical protein